MNKGALRVFFNFLILGCFPLLVGTVDLKGSLPSKMAAFQDGSFEGMIAYLDGQNVWLVNLKDNNRTQITHDAGTITVDNELVKSVWYHDLAWSPDGRKLSFLQSLYEPDSDNSVQRSLWIYDLDNKSSQNLLTTSSYAWNPKKPEIVYYKPGQEMESGLHEGPLENPGGLWAFNTVTGNQTEFLKAERGYPIAWPRFSADGRFLSFEEFHYIEGRGLFGYYDTKKGAAHFWSETAGAYSWSPDGENIIYDGVIYAEEPGSQIWKSNPNGRTKQPITNSEPLYATMDPKYSPSGEQIIFRRTSFKNPTTIETTLWIMNSDGTNPSQLTSLNEVALADWSPDGEMLVISNGIFTQSNEIFIYDFQSNKLSKIVDGTNPVWQPTVLEPMGECGKWKWDGPNQPKDLRIKTTPLMDETMKECGGVFRLDNDTELFGWKGGYIFELDWFPTNTAVEWLDILPQDHVEEIFLLPPFEIQVHTIPEDPYSNAELLIKGFTNFETFKRDLSLFAIKTALALLDLPGSCIIPEENLFEVAIKVSNLLNASAKLAWKGDFTGAWKEFLLIGETFFDQVADAFVDVGVECVSEEILKKISSKPGVIAKIGWEEVSWVSKYIWDYFKFGDLPAEVRIIYTYP